ncbi:Uncharacterised protein [Pasteurella multocida]|nr:Uncharacterised protein [Pasteurella multocida]HDR1931833.1 hypothetical protein [Pasteurella multocida]
MNQFNVIAEQSRAERDPNLDALNDIIDGSEDLEKIEKAYKLIEKHNDNELHDIRKNHLNRLFTLTCVWSGLVIYILISLGLGRLLWFSATPSHHTDIAPFKLEPSVIIAFITSTTATIIGLYTIAAYWLFKKKD